MHRVAWLGAFFLVVHHRPRRLLVRADYSTVEIYSDAHCQSTPLVVTLEKVANATCNATTATTCSATEINDSAYYYAQRCATDRLAYTASLFRGAKYLMIDGFEHEPCATYARSNVFLAAGTCQLASYVGTRSAIATLFNDGTAYMTIYNDSACGTKAQVFDLNASTIASHRCYRGYNKFYSSIHTGLEEAGGQDAASGSGQRGDEIPAPVPPTTTTSVTLGAVVGLVLALVLLPALVLYGIFRRTRKTHAPRRAPHTRPHPDLALALSHKHEQDERYAPEMSPRSQEQSTASVQTDKSTHAMTHDAQDPHLFSSYPVDRPRGNSGWTHERRRGRTGGQGDGVATGSSRGRLHPHELCTPFERSQKLQREDLGDPPADARRPADGARTEADEPPLHAQRLRGPVTADSVCTDDAILSSRIPRDHVVVENLIGRGGYGEVYRGTYEGRAVAVKMLFPETRKSTRHVTEFLTEVKMMSVLDHPRVVAFLGVSWHNLMDLCVVTEYMAGGDLRAWLSDRVDKQLPVGFDAPKVTIATHVAHALAYLHSLSPAVIHRDLKSRNILLSATQDAKLADFGASRERVDRTMTAGVGTSLWIAPEVMMGERYDDKADIFSFGVVLSELDSHQTPYAHAKENKPAGRKLPETAILQLVAMGKMRIEFSPGALKSVVELGVACTAIDPTERPTAVEAFQKLQGILRHVSRTVTS
ncbi:hypothetical protein PsorP6_011875 [Peronosclerospora sorghi]|uniref:Uncharacterized protein n=1 Tax=Peronosclerospora sorghi TaxID=230839 RepID=A0ACC0WJZ7_9STRA|nr:hypothetical protein PsorP6_011875 [Peronosclerospora sorghi]